MNKYISIMLGLLSIFLMSNVTALSWSNTTFNNSLGIENLTFTTNQNFTRYLQIPSSVSAIINATINFTGYSFINKEPTVLLLYSFEKNTSTSVTDEYLSRFNATMMPSPITITNSRTGLGRAMQTDGSVLTQMITPGNNTAFRLNHTQGYTISLWLNSSNFGGSGDRVFNKGRASPDYELSLQGGYNIAFASTGSVELFFNLLSIGIRNDTWYHVVIMGNSTRTSMFWNGTLVNSTINPSPLQQGAGNLSIGAISVSDGGFWNGQIDEFTIINKSLNTTEILELYNLNYSLGTRPRNSTLRIENQAVWNFTSELNQDNNKSSDFGASLSRYLNSTYLVGSNYLIPFNFYSEIGTLQYLNLLFSNNGFRENSQTFNNITTSLSTETFRINVTYDTNTYTSNVGTLVYNNTRYSSTSINDGLNTIFSTSITIPSTTAQINKSFYWEMDLINSTQHNYFNSTSKNQSIYPFNIDNCTVYTELVLNFTERDEGTIAILNQTTTNTSMDIEVLITSRSDSSQQIRFNQTFFQINPARVCVGAGTLGNGTWILDSQVRYTARDYAVEFYNIQNATLNNNSFPQNINLFPLLTTDSQEFLINYKDENFLPVENALITLTRKYIGDGLFRTVEAPETNDDGQAIIHMVLGDIIYTIQVSKNGRLLSTFDNIVPFCINAAQGDCQINLNAFSTGTAPTDYETNNNLTYNFVFSQSARTITLTYTTLDGSSALVSINSTLFDNRGNTTVCTSQIQSSAGTLVCSIPVSIGNSSVQTYLYKDGRFIDVAYFYFNRNTPSQTFGSTGTIMLVLMFISLPLMFITNPIGIVVGAIIGLIFGSLLNLYTSGSILGIASTFIWIILAGGIIIWKINNKET